MKIIKLRGILFVLLIASIAFSGACGNDPYSQRRIRMRTDHARQVAEEYLEHDREGAQRLENRRRELDRWWKSNEERTRYNFEVLGDYVW